MPILSIPTDAFSHGQIKSKLWLCENFSAWLNKYLSIENESYILNWYGSWVGIGPFLLMSQHKNIFKKINLYDLNSSDLQTSQYILDYWKCESVEINLHNIDINSFKPPEHSNQIFINTSCEHILEDTWLNTIPSGAHVLLQSTDMPHVEHVNTPKNLDHFLKMYSNHLSILETQFLSFDYPDKKFNRYMLFGAKK